MAPATLYDNFKPYHRRISNGIRRDGRCYEIPWDNLDRSGAQDYVPVAVYRVQNQFLKKQLTSLEKFGLTFSSSEVKHCFVYLISVHFP